MAGTNVESARQKSTGDEMVSAEFLPQAKPPRAKQPCNHPLASSSIERKENCANWKSC
jgi:hypothetical protein